MKKLAAIGAMGLLASSLFAQGLNTGGQTKDDWEEINFEFNSSILSDGYPSLLRLADQLAQHRDYRVKVTGHTDYVGSAAYNEKLALKRADAVKAFLVKYGVAENQIATAGDGKRMPEVDNKSKEGRFMNRRVVLTLTDGNGHLIKEGGIGDVIKAGDRIDSLLAMMSSLSPMALMISAMPPSLIRRPLPSVRVRTTRRFMNRPSLVLLSTSGARLPSPAVAIWLSATPYFTRNALTASARLSASLSLYAAEPT